MKDLPGRKVLLLCSFAIQEKAGRAE
ncbi:hypothetical protein B14911_05424 [Bacillus sp. NRRL B-14911]|nr:hypothetical protein B14911_05424 [Bacillus sp. NRRL B-14911]